MAVTLDLTALRVFLLGLELGSFSLAASALGRSPSAVSAQMRKLEQAVGAPLLYPVGRGLRPTRRGVILKAYAQRLLDLQDEAVASLHSEPEASLVRLGLQEDFAEHDLEIVLRAFRLQHPDTPLEITIARNRPLLEGIANDTLDIAFVWNREGDSSGEHVATRPMHWIGSRESAERPAAGENANAVPLVTFAPPCIFRDAAVEALHRAKLSWRVGASSPSLSGLEAAVKAGLGLMVRPGTRDVALEVLDYSDCDLPELPSATISMRRNLSSGPAALTLADMFAAHLRNN
ncbi:LysR substrate-binding domain-containing protein [Leisingera sp.]|uniref:LysR substrate-binding domain-containing protein n=1 Tax=Leisingera sp. TaxID=1879318 RepID=UPI002B26B9DA|nr:LysR substrate-binding domain-containing protein [Leisingera sp.]